MFRGPKTAGNPARENEESVRTAARGEIELDSVEVRAKSPEQSWTSA